MFDSKRIATILCASTVALTACASDAPGIPADATGVPPSALSADSVPVVDGSVCVVTDLSGIDDNGINRNSTNGALRAAEDLGVAAQILESTSEDDYAAHIESFIDDGCALIVTTGALLANATAEAAAANVDQQFAIVDFQFQPSIPNVLSLDFDAVESAFLAGYLAAGVTETGVVATYGGINISAFTKYMDGFRNGVDYYNNRKGASVEVLGWNGVDGTFAGNFDNVDDGVRIAADFVAQGADVIMPAAGAVGQGTASFATGQENLRVIGIDNDQFLRDPQSGSVYLTSAIKHTDVAVLAATQAIVINGELGARYVGTLENGGVGLAPFHEQDGDVSDQLKAELEELSDGIIAGDISTS